MRSRLKTKRRNFLSCLGAWLATGSVSLPAAQSKSPQLIRRWDSSHLLETPLETLGAAQITAARDFFVMSRQDMTVAESERAQWKIRIAGEVSRPVEIPLEVLRSSWKTVRVQSYIQCAGFGRKFFDPAIKDVPWERGAVGNAEWEGVRLSELLGSAGLRDSARFVAFAGKDASPEPPGAYIKSLPLAKAGDPQTLVAFRMNGQEIPVEHGGPVRLIVPGWVGTYSLKWLLRIAVLDRPWDGYWMSRAYRVPAHPIAPGTVEESVETVALTTCKVNSVITAPLDGALLSPGRSVVEGFAWSGEGELEEVAVTTNGGKTWTPAVLEASSGPYAWRRWRLNWDAAPGSYQILARARDASGAVQPSDRTAWNPGGYGWNAAHAVGVRVAK